MMSQSITNIVNFALVTQKQNNDKYNQELANWKKGGNVQNPNGISSSEISQHLVLGREPQAKVNFSNVTGSLVNPTWIYDRGGDWGSHADQDYANYGPDGTDYTLRENGSVPGVVVTATYTGLQNSYYTDNNGVKHKISKIVRTFSNLSSDESKRWITLNSDLDPSVYNSGNPELIIYSDPADGFWYNWSDGVTTTDQYYDDNGNIINIEGNGYLAVTSLNNEGHQGSQLYNDQHIEQASVLSGGRALTLQGSSISDHNGVLYSNTNNTNGSGINSGSNWDNKTSNHQYYGTGLVQISGDKVSIRFSTERNANDITPGVWATTSTIIPTTPGPKKPNPTTVHYHYDPKITSFRFRTRLNF